MRKLEYCHGKEAADNVTVGEFLSASIVNRTHFDTRNRIWIVQLLTDFVIGCLLLRAGCSRFHGCHSDKERERIVKVDDVIVVTEPQEIANGVKPDCFEKHVALGSAGSLLIQELPSRR